MNGQKTLVPSGIRWGVAGLAGYALLGGGATLAGWFAGLPRLTDWAGSGISMFPNAALGAVCSGAALILGVLNSRWCAWLSGVLGGVVLLIGGATLFEHLSGIDLGIDTILARPAWGERAAVALGRMGPPACTAYSLLGLALILNATARGRGRRLVPALGLIVCGTSMLSLMGYAMGADPLFAIKLTGIALQTATVLLALGMGVVASVPEGEPMRTLRANSAAGAFARRSLPFIIGLPFILSWLRVRGQNAGWFDPAMGTSLVTLALVAIFCGLLGWWVRAIANRETALAQARDLLATTVASIGDAVMVTDEEGKVTFMNAEAEKLSGWKNSEANGQPLPRVFRIINEQTREEAENPVAKVFRTGKVAGLANHTLLISKSGAETPIDDSAAPIRDADGPIAGVVLVFRNVAQQRRAQQAASRLAAIVEQSGDAILTKNLASVIETWNPGAERLFGYRAEEIVGQPVTLLVPPDRLNEEDVIIGRLRQGKPVERLETIRVAKDGRRIPVAVSVSPLRNGDGEVVGASKIIHDNSDIVATREALLREKEMLGTTLASIGDAVIVTDAEGRITFLNAEAERLTRWSGAHAIGEPLPAVFRIINEKTRAAVENPVEKVLRLGSVVGLANHTVLIARDGTETPIDDSAAPIRRPGGPLFGVVLVFRDFTERKKAEAAQAQLITVQKETEEKLRDTQRRLLMHAAALEATVAERTAKLQESVDELQSFSYSIAHDMRAPLRAMGTFAHLLMNELPAASASPETKTYCEGIVTGAARLDNLITDALNYTKAVLKEFPTQSVDLSRLVQGLVATYPNLQVESSNIAIEGTLPVVVGNESLLTQCFSNLLGNAVKFVAPGTCPKVRVRAEAEDGFARIWVEDNGIGIPKHAQPRLFAMFQKLDNQYEGTGVGLAIVRKVVERMGGKVGVESEPGNGSRFWVELRVAAEKEGV